MLLSVLETIILSKTGWSIMNRIEDYNELETSIVTWIQNYTNTNKIKSLVVGVSGGIDSAVVSTHVQRRDYQLMLCLCHFIQGLKACAGINQSLQVFAVRDILMSNMFVGIIICL